MNPDSERIPVTRANGIALAVSMPDGGLLSGQAALMMLDGWTWEDMTLKPPVGMVKDRTRIFADLTDIRGFFFISGNPPNQR